MVTLSGSIDSEAEKRRVERDAAHVPGIKAVCNDLTVKSET